MQDEQEVYKQIKIFKKESEDCFLLLYENRTLSVGFLVKDILVFLQNGIFEPVEIKKELLNEYNLKLDVEDVKKAIVLMHKFVFEEKTDLSFLKFGKLINPEIIRFNLSFFFDKFVFYSSLISFFIINIFISMSLQYSRIDNVRDWTIWVLLLVGVLFVHELGHVLSARRYGVNCKEIGAGLYFIFPVLYTNLGEAWRLKKEKRIIINLSGIYFQLMFGIIIGLLAWFAHSNILSFFFFTNFTIVLLNLNPFIKFDGYWIVADLLNIGNLAKAANNELIRFFSFKFRNGNAKLSIYAFFRMIFILFFAILLLSLSFSLVRKIYHAIPLSYRDYFLIIFILYYLFKKIKQWTFKSKSRNI